jgi:aspartyl-tRNA(Asn)/glutamyl-tRNA(Gln) amidotransferase subunit C
MAMFNLPEAERVALKERFDEIANGFSALDKYDTYGVEPLVTVLDLHNILRDDIPTKFMPRDELMKNAPEQEDGYFRVPATIG